MRLLPVLILITFSVIAIKIFSIAFDQNPLISGVEPVLAAEETTEEPAEGEAEPTPENVMPFDETSPEAQKAAAAEAKKNKEIASAKAIEQSAQNRKNIDLLLAEQEKKGAAQFFSDTEIQLLQSLKARRDLLDKRERKIDVQAKLLLAAEQQLDSKIARLAALEAVIKQKLGEVNEKEVNRFTSLVKTYETMKPKEAAGILSILDLSIMEKIARSMSTKKLAPIMAKMDMKAARALTIRLAQPPAELTAENMALPPMAQSNSELPQLALE
ncbi:MAG: hypothetical protein OCD03_14245 [Hyphomicrobiales bacterium]